MPPLSFIMQRGDLPGGDSVTVDEAVVRVQPVRKPKGRVGIVAEMVLVLEHFEALEQVLLVVKFLESDGI